MPAFIILSSQTVSDKLESVQRQAIRIIYDCSVGVEDVMERERIETLQARRTRACLSFANRTVNLRFGRRWFPINPNSRDARTTTRRKFEEKIPRTES